MQANRFLKQIVDTALPHWTTPSSAAAVDIRRSIALLRSAHLHAGSTRPLGTRTRRSPARHRPTLRSCLGGRAAVLSSLPPSTCDAALVLARYRNARGAVAPSKIAVSPAREGPGRRCSRGRPGAFRALPSGRATYERARKRQAAQVLGLRALSPPGALEQQPRRLGPAQRSKVPMSSAVTSTWPARAGSTSRRPTRKPSSSWASRACSRKK